MEKTSMLNVKEVAKYLNINEKMVYTLISEKRLPATKVTGKWLFSRHLIDQWVLSNTQNIPHTNEKNRNDSETLIITGSNDILLERLISHYNRHTLNRIAVFGNMGSMGGIQALNRGCCDIATSHLIQDDEEDYNFAFIDLELTPAPAVVNFCRRQQGILLSKGNPDKIKGIKDLARSNLHFVNRAEGTGTRLLLDRELAKAEITPGDIQGYATVVDNHLAVGMEIMRGKADAGLAIRPVAALLGLDFVPLRWERYDFLINRDRFFNKNVQQFLGLLKEDVFNKMSADITGYDISISGSMLFPGQSK